MTEKAFTMDDLKKRIQEQAVVSMGMMMPAEALKELIDKAIDEFFTGDVNWRIDIRESGDYYNRQRHTEGVKSISPFTLIVWDTITPIIKEVLKTYFDKENEAIEKSLEESILNEDFRVKAATSAALLAPDMARRESLESLRFAIRRIYEGTRDNFSCSGMQTHILTDSAQHFVENL